MRTRKHAAAAIAALGLAACETPGEPGGAAAPVAQPMEAGVGAEPRGDEPIILPTNEERAFAAEIADRLARARYMEQDCAPAEFPGWERLPLQQCAYEAANADGTKRSAKVIMLNPPSEQLARWIFSTCRAVEKDNAQCRIALFRQVLSASGGQFPVAGVVLEDIRPRDGEIESYAFRNGVTVRLAGIPNGGTRQLSDSEIAAALSADTPIALSRRYARIVSTGPDDYRANGGTADVGTTADPSLDWPAVAGALYRDAWGSANNELMTAWARAHLDRL